MKTLIPMMDFVLNPPMKGMEVQSMSFQGARRFNLCQRYAKFLKQPLILEMFVPVDDGSIIDEGENNYYWDVLIEELKADGYSMGSEESCLITEEKARELIKIRREQAQEKVLFKGFEVDNIDNAVVRIRYKTGFILNWLTIDKQFWARTNENVEHLISIQQEIELTESALKQIGL